MLGLDCIYLWFDGIPRIGIFIHSYFLLALNECQLCVSTMLVAGNTKMNRVWLLLQQLVVMDISVVNWELMLMRCFSLLSTVPLVRALRDTEVKSIILVLTVFLRKRGNTLVIRMSGWASGDKKVMGKLRWAYEGWGTRLCHHMSVQQPFI